MVAHLDLCGAAMNLTTYSKENQPTNTASAISKKYSSPENVSFKFDQVITIKLMKIETFESVTDLSCIIQWKRVHFDFQSEPQRPIDLSSFPKKSFNWEMSIVQKQVFPLILFSILRETKDAKASFVFFFPLHKIGPVLDKL